MKQGTLILIKEQVLPKIIKKLEENDILGITILNSNNIVKETKVSTFSSLRNVFNYVYDESRVVLFLFTEEQKLVIEDIILSYCNKGDFIFYSTLVDDVMGL